jgi:hypothetical protein
MKGCCWNAAVTATPAAASSSSSSNITLEVNKNCQSLQALLEME